MRGTVKTEGIGDLANRLIFFKQQLFCRIETQSIVICDNTFSCFLLENSFQGGRGIGKMCRQLAKLNGVAQVFSEIFLDGGGKLFSLEILGVGINTKADVSASGGIKRKQQKLYGVLDKLQMKCGGVVTRCHKAVCGNIQWAFGRKIGLGMRDNIPKIQTLSLID